MSIWSPESVVLLRYPSHAPMNDAGPTAMGCGCGGTGLRPAVKSTCGGAYGPERRTSKSVPYRAACTSPQACRRHSTKSPVSSMLSGLSHGERGTEGVGGSLLVRGARELEGVHVFEVGEGVDEGFALVGVCD